MYDSRSAGLEHSRFPITVPRSIPCAQSPLWALFLNKVVVFMAYSDALLSRVLTRARVIAVVGISANSLRPSYFVARYLGLRGFRVIGVNPGIAGQMLFGERVYANLTEIPFEVDMVDIFRQSDAVPGIVDEALARWPGLQTIWMQIGVVHAAAAAVAEARGVTVIQNLCPKQEYQRLFGELRKGGFATGIISSKL